AAGRDREVHDGLAAGGATRLHGALVTALDGRELILDHARDLGHLAAPRRRHTVARTPHAAAHGCADALAMQDGGRRIGAGIVEAPLELAVPGTGAKKESEKDHPPHTSYCSRPPRKGESERARRIRRTTSTHTAIDSSESSASACHPAATNTT